MSSHLHEPTYGTLPANIGLTLPNLKLFEFGNNKFFGLIPSSLCNASQLQKLDLGNNSFVGSVPTNLGYRLDLKLLRLTSNNLGRDLDFLMTLRNCTKMEELGIDANQLKGVLPNSIGNLSTLNLIDANFFFFLSLFVAIT